MFGGVRQPRHRTVEARQEFALAMDELAPEIEVRVLAPGMSTSF
jgi:hypothetical protein